MPGFSDGGKAILASAALPQLIGSARGPLAGPVTGAAPLDRMWACKVGDADVVRPGRRPHKLKAGGETAREPLRLRSSAEPRCGSAPFAAAERGPGVLQVMHWVEKELRLQGLQGAPPSVDRARIFATAFIEVIEMLPSYRPLLLAVQKEYDSFIGRLQADLAGAGSLEGRLRTLKAESLNFVGESMNWFHMEIARLRSRLAQVEGERDALILDKSRLEKENAKLQDMSERDHYQATESHAQNLDIVRYLERMEKQVELLRKTEKELHVANKQLELRCKDKDARILTVEDQLQVERVRAINLVSREEYEATKEELRHAEVRNKELEELYAGKHRDYLSIVSTYTKSIGQSIDEARPLTPRPTWTHCHGIIDPDMTHSTDKAAAAQEILQGMLDISRTLLSAYGLIAASERSTVFKMYAKHPLTAPIVFERRVIVTERLTQSKEPMTSMSGGFAPPGGNEDHLDAGAAKEALVAAFWEDEFLAPDIDQLTPVALRHPEQVKNLRFSRRKVADFIDGIIQMRYRFGGNTMSRPFLDFMLEHLPKDLQAEELKAEFALNIFAAVRHYAAEPDFLAYLLLLTGRISDAVVRDNKALSAELVRLFLVFFEGSGRTVPKQKFFYGLREVLQNKAKSMWQDLVTYFPAGGPEVSVNYDSLLVDDFHLTSPVVYALRLQHLDEAVALGDRLERATRSSMQHGSTVVRYEAAEAQLRKDPEMSMLTPEDYAKAFGTSVMQLRPDLEQDIHKFVAAMRHSDMFHVLLFPCMPSDDADMEFEDEEMI